MMALCYLLMNHTQGVVSGGYGYEELDLESLNLARARLFHLYGLPLTRFAECVNGRAEQLYENVCFAESLKVYKKVLALAFISFLLTEMEIPQLTWRRLLRFLPLRSGRRAVPWQSLPRRFVKKQSRLVLWQVFSLWTVGRTG